jgi:ATP-dependent DNA helicase RecG
LFFLRTMQAEYIKTRGLKDDHFKKLILEYLDKCKHASKEDIDKLLLDILPGVLDEDQRKNKIRNLIYAMSKKDKTIINLGTNRYPKWVRV